MITLEEVVWVIKSYKYNRNKILARCLECNTLDWWPKSTPKDQRVCFICWCDPKVKEIIK